MKRVILFIAILLDFIGIQAQNPFAEYGYTPKIATLSQGEYNEFFDNDTLVQIGSVLFNTKSNQIVAFIETDTLYSEATLEPDIISRWISPDPLAEKYLSISPYVYVANNPINIIDPDGRYLFGLIGSTSEQRQAARNYAEATNGRVDNLTKKSIHVDYQTVESSQEGNTIAVTVTDQTQSFRRNGHIETGSEVANGMVDEYYSKLESGNYHTDLNTGELVKQPASGKIDLSPVNVEDLIGLAMIGKALLSNVAKEGTQVLEGAAKSNYGRFVSKMPANAKTSASYQVLDDGNYLFQATSPGKVPGSSALYQKWVNPQGETFKMIKTTIAPDGSIIHVKPKF